MNIKKTYQGKTPAGLTSQNIVVAFKWLAHEGEQFTSPPNAYSTLQGVLPFPSPFKKK
jgi:hypothetical protein